MHTKSVYQSLADQHSGVYADRGLWSWDETRPELRHGGQEVGTSKAVQTQLSSQTVTFQELNSHDLIPVVTATWPSRLNQPVIHDASGALSGLVSMAAQ